ncbi:MAG: hypothetical protein M1118_14815 [Chloroflexi bacterium]|nr:hypothetical protein [Chloroflexota bacterium]
MAGWTDDPATSSTHIRTVHINELRRTVLRNRYKAGLGGVTWSDGPWATSRTHIRAVHFTEVHDAMTPYLGILTWSVGSPPAPSRQISARDINDLRNWTDQFSAVVGQSDPDLGTWSYTYNPIGTLASRTDAKSRRSPLPTTTWTG